ncbi:MAG: hypothetical protein CME63_16775 [Halobacteriovoraceae bacterium]|nr:hypothetical protein [Halobacteriovoraceae bacterium]
MSFQSLNKIIESRYLRRENLIVNMQSLETKNINCSSCQGKCCTMMANSMMMTPIETMDLYKYLKDEGLWTNELIDKLTSCIKDFRLAEQLDLGRGRVFRRTYTCPFYLNQFPGCPLPRSVKPYGCLAFNPGQGTPSDGEGCHSELALLEKREDLVESEEDLNQLLKERMNLTWEKLPIPVALLEMDKVWEQLEDTQLP